LLVLIQPLETLEPQNISH